MKDNAIPARSGALSSPRPPAGEPNADCTRDASSPMNYGGPERRRHRVFVTRNTEYHFRDSFCVAVRDRRTGEFLHGHLALRRMVNGGIRFFPNGAIAPNPGEPRPGEALYFANDERDLITSPLERIERPSKELAQAYPAPAIHAICAGPRFA